MNFSKPVCCAVLLGFAAAPLLAEPQSTSLYKYKHWEVEAVQYDDGSLACLAEVDAQTDSFTLWVSPDQSVRLQFYSTSWEFGEGDTANLQVEIDRRGAWTLTNAELYKNSILFDLPDSDQGVRFLTEVAQGRTAHLKTESGEGVMDYSLSGSHASINALIECADAIR
jgi:hypothetical protein